MKKLMTISMLAAVLSVGIATNASASGEHGHDVGGRAMHAGPAGAGAFAGDRRHGNNAYAAASEEVDRLLNTKLKSICRGC